MAQKLTTCTFCGVGCGLYLETDRNQVIGVYPSMSHPANRGRICVRGWHVHEVASSPDRLTTPLIRKNDRLEPVSWPEAIRFIADRLRSIRDKHGPDALAFLNSPRCSNEESYLLQKLARTVIGTNNVDHGTGVYCNNSINVLIETLGTPASTNALEELDRSAMIIVDGIDLARQMPTIAGLVIRAKLNGAKLAVVDPRRHRLAHNARFFLQLKPGTESQLYGAMAKVIVDRGLMNLPFIQARCRNYEAFLNRLSRFDLLQASETCGVPAELIEATALEYARARSAAILFSTGIETRDADAIRALVNLALLAGQIGREGAGIFALTEHNNLQGVCDMGMLPDRLPGYRLVSDALARRELETLWNASLPSRPGLATRSLLTDRNGGRVRGVWLCRYDPASTAFFGDAARALGDCELVIVQHLLLTETARLADVVLPTTAFGEERVTFTNTERRIQLAQQVLDPLPGTLPAWQQLNQVANALGAGWKYDSAAEVMDEIGRAIPFYSGASHENLGREFGRQWPCTLDRPLGTARLFAETEPGHPFHFSPTAEPRDSIAPSDAFPLALVFGHSLYYWHQNVLIKHSETLKREYRMLLLDYPQGFVEIHPDDASRLQIRDGERIRLCAAEGCAATAARVTPEVRSGSVFVPYFVREVQRQIRGSLDNGVQVVPVRIEKEAG